MKQIAQELLTLKMSRNLILDKLSREFINSCHMNPLQLIKDLIAHLWKRMGEVRLVDGVRRMKR